MKTFHLFLVSKVTFKHEFIPLNLPIKISGCFKGGNAFNLTSSWFFFSQFRSAAPFPTIFHAQTSSDLTICNNLTLNCPLKHYATCELPLNSENVVHYKERGRMRINDFSKIFPLLFLKGNFLVLLKCAVQLPEDQKDFKCNQRENDIHLKSTRFCEFIAIYSFKEHYAKKEQSNRNKCETLEPSPLKFFCFFFCLPHLSW